MGSDLYQECRYYEGLETQTKKFIENSGLHYIKTPYKAMFCSKDGNVGEYFDWGFEVRTYLAPSGNKVNKMFSIKLNIPFMIELETGNANLHESILNILEDCESGIYPIDKELFRGYNAYNKDVYVRWEAK